MDKFLKWWNQYRNTACGEIISAGIYAGMLILICMCFTGNGTFIYELG